MTNQKYCKCGVVLIEGEKSLCRACAATYNKKDELKKKAESVLNVISGLVIMIVLPIIIF